MDLGALAPPRPAPPPVAIGRRHRSPSAVAFEFENKLLQSVGTRRGRRGLRVPGGRGHAAVHEGVVGGRDEEAREAGACDNAAEEEPDAAIARKWHHCTPIIVHHNFTNHSMYVLCQLT